jgi:hypothetical protein
MIETFSVPIDPSDLMRIAEALRARDVFTPTFAALDVDLYNPAVYLQQVHRFDTATVLLADRNLISRWVGLVRGTPPTPEHRLAAGVLAFAQCAEIDIEPNIALYELARSRGAEAARLELAAFRLADHIHPGYWGEIALGRSQGLGGPTPVGPVGPNDLTIDFSMWLRRWRRNYILCLKIAELELEGGSAAARMSRFMTWMDRDFLFGGPALVMAAHCLAPNAGRRRLLKSIRSPDRARAIEGVRNATWDLTLVSEWMQGVERQDGDSRLTLLTSLDRGIHALARAVTDVECPGSSVESGIYALFVELWGEKMGTRLAGQLVTHYASLADPQRQLNRPAPDDFLAKYIQRGEAAIVGWLP